MKDTDKKIKNKRADKNMQDDWLPDQTRAPDATSGELPEYGGDLKERDSIEEQSDKKKGAP
ncbi:MAG: hypothetical protein ACXVLQ_12565 [Bacteriovorax sp.]